MTNNLDELLELLVYYADSIGSRRDKKSGKDMYTCPFCHSGEHGIGSTGAMHIGRSKDGKLLYYCHSCNSGGNIVNMYCQYHGITQTKDNFSQIIKGLRQDLGLSTKNYQDFKKSYKFRNPIQDDDLKPQSKVDKKDYINFFNLSLQNQDKAIDYLRNVRKIKYAESIAKYFQIGFIPNYAYEWKDNQPYKKTSAIIIPTSQYSYAWRSTTENLKKKSGMVRPLNIEVLNNKSKKYLFLVEGEFDLFSILDITNDIPNCEFSAISVNSAGNLPRFLENQIKEKIQEGVTLIIALDNDTEPNPNVENFIQKGLDIAKKNKIPCVVADVKSLYLNQKDSNEALKFNREEFKKALINEVEKAKTIDFKEYTKLSEEQPKKSNVSPEITKENITKPQIYDYILTLTSEIDIVNYIQAIKDKAIEFDKLKDVEPLCNAYKKEALKRLSKQKKEMAIPKDAPDWYHELKLTNDGKFKNSLLNIETILKNDEQFKDTIQYNEFTQKRMLNSKEYDDTSDSLIKKFLEQKYDIIASIENINHACNIIQLEHTFHPIKDYLCSLKWDGVNRIETIFIDFLGANDNLYTRKVAQITLISAIARIFDSGCKVDTVTCLVGRQGIGKSKFLRKLAINSAWFTDNIISFDGKEFYETIQGKWLVEIGEGTAFKKSLTETAKQKITQQEDIYRTPYERYPKTRPRQCIFIATTNNYDFLKDETGNRRYYPIDCNPENITLSIDNDLTSEYVNQLWAEALTLYNNGVKHYIDDKNIIETAIQEQKQHYEKSPIQDDVENYLSVKIPNNWDSLCIQDKRYHIHCVINDTYEYSNGQPLRLEETNQRDYVSIQEILCEYYEKSPNDVPDSHGYLYREIKKTLISLGYTNSNGERKRIKGYGSRVSIFRKTT